MNLLVYGGSTKSSVTNQWNGFCWSGQSNLISDLSSLSSCLSRRWMRSLEFMAVINDCAAPVSAVRVSAATLLHLAVGTPGLIPPCVYAVIPPRPSHFLS
jgi:hypothetical protein